MYCVYGALGLSYAQHCSVYCTGAFFSTPVSGMFMTGQITVANRTSAHIIVSLWKSSPLTLGATERPLNFAPKKPGEVFKRGFHDGGRGDKIKIFGGEYSIRAGPYTEEHLLQLQATRSRVGLTLKERPAEAQASIQASGLSRLYDTSVEEIMAAVQAAALCSSRQTLGEQLWDSLQNGLAPLAELSAQQLARTVLTWVFQLYSSDDLQGYLDTVGRESWKLSTSSADADFDSMSVIDLVSAVGSLLPQVQQAASMAGIMMHAAGLLGDGDGLAAIEEEAFALQLQEWRGNPQLSTAVETGKADGSEYAVVGGPGKSVYLVDWRMHIVQVGDVDPYNPL